MLLEINSNLLRIYNKKTYLKFKKKFLVAVYVSPQYFGFGMLFIAQATALLMFFFNGLERSLAKRVVSQAARPSKVVRQDETWKQENSQEKNKLLIFYYFDMIF